jgi:hypothetical protein
MKLNKKAIAGGAALLSVVLIAGAVSVASATTQTNGSDGPIYIANGETGDYITDGASNAWAASITASSSATDVTAGVTCGSNATGIFTFISARGSERTQSAWKAFSVTSFGSGKNVSLPDLSPTFQTSGEPGQAATKTAGGDLSMGIACTTNNGVTVVGAYYRYITVTPSTGAFTVTATADVVSTPSSTPTPVNTSLNSDIALSATTMSAENGTLSLSVPANAAATFGSPSLVNNKSTTRGTLPNITVNDGRVVTRQGWTLTATVADFVNATDSANIIGKANLGIAPAIVAGSTTAAGITVGTATVAGLATYGAKFAEAAAANVVGDTVLNGALTFVAPQEKAAGTYTSTLTLTLVSK